jgi:hypothetical protein
MRHFLKAGPVVIFPTALAGDVVIVGSSSNKKPAHGKHRNAGFHGHQSK